MLPSTLNASKKKKFPTRNSTAPEILRNLQELSMVPRVPSIPTRSQSYGYEPTVNGRLELQEPPVPGFKGTKGDTVGPGDYDPDISAVSRNKPRAVFPYSPRELSGVNKKLVTPGPGTYNQLSAFDLVTAQQSNYKSDYVVRLNEVRARQSAVFESKASRDSLSEEINRKFAPGPQHYNIPSTLQPGKPALKQFFSSSSRRFSNVSFIIIIQYRCALYYPITEF
jgi:Sperm-tail PG-rich repeat